jgi:predicted dienelactone hydrolase
MWERPKDISVVLDKMINDPLFSKKIDTGRIAVAGFSLGGATAIWVAGAIFDIDRLAKSDPNIPERYREDVNRFTLFVQTNPIGINSAKHREDSFKDNRIKAVFALSPAIGQGFDKQGLRNITIPVQIVVGDADIVNPMDLNAKHYTQNIPTALPLIVLPGERGHYIKPSTGNERPGELQEVSELAASFFKQVLK